MPPIFPSFRTHLSPLPNLGSARRWVELHCGREVAAERWVELDSGAVAVRRPAPRSCVAARGISAVMLLYDSSTAGR
uniref:Uncharacterized protein n=1 Tax=Arundo donax TaxID=35708 RepID=A0A0A8YBZ6_ARUDO